MRLLILRTSALGDIVHTLPVLVALRRNLPDAVIAWVVEEAFSPLLETHSDLDLVIPIKARAWRYRATHRSTRDEIFSAVRAMRRFRPDVALDLMGNHKAALLARLSGAPRRVGFERRSRREPSSVMWINEPVAPRGTHAVDRALSLLDALGLPDEPADFGGGRFLQTAAPEAELDRSAGFALIHPGAGWENKRYPAAWWGEVARGLRAASSLEIFVAGGPGEDDLAQEAVKGSEGNAVALSLPTLADLAAAQRRATLVLAGDTGPLHLAHALGVRVLAVMGPTDPERNGPYRAPERALVHHLPCSFCHKRLSETKACLLSIPPRRVVERAMAVLEEGGSSPQSSAL